MQYAGAILRATLATGLFWVGALAFGWMVAAACMTAVAVHEAGHGLFLRCCGVRAAVFVSPFLGLTLPLDSNREYPAYLDGGSDDAEEREFLSATGSALYFLAGSGLSLALAAAARGLLAAWQPRSEETCVFLRLASNFALLMNCLNLGALSTVTDGGRVLLQAASHLGRRGLQACGIAGIAQGAAILASVEPLLCVPVTLVSVWTLPRAVQSCERSAWQTTAAIRTLIVGLWLAILTLSAAMLLADPLSRDILLHLLGIDRDGPAFEKCFT